MSAQTLLTQMLEADRALREARDRVLDESVERRGLLEALEQEVNKGFTDADGHEGAARLLALTDVLAEIGGTEGSRLLLRVLGHEESAVRQTAGEALMDLMYERYAEVARVIETVVDKGEDVVALAEVPFLLAEVGEPGGVKIVTKLLRHKDADVAGAAIEALAMLGDPTAIKAIEPLRNDKRRITVEDESEGNGEITLGDLADEAIAHLRELKAS